MDQLTLRAENAKKLLSSINKKFPHYQNRTRLAKSIKKIEYAIKVTLKKIQTIQGHIQLYAEVSKSTETPKKRKLFEDTLPEKTHQMTPPKVNNSEPHSVSTSEKTETPSVSPETRSSGQVIKTESTPQQAPTKYPEITLRQSSTEKLSNQLKVNLPPLNPRPCY